MLARSLSTTRLALLAVATLIVLAAGAPAAHAAPCDPPVTNPVACENTLPGADPSTWEIEKAGDDSIQGYATAMSVNKGETVSFKIKSATPNFRIDILRLGYYGGKGARLMQGNLAPTGPSTQPACQEFPASGLVDCGNWSVTRTWTVPSTAVSGVYIAYLRRNDTGDASHITFVVRDDASTSQVVVQTSDATWQAYNTYGGNSLYTCEPTNCPPGNPSTYKAAYKVSYNRPFNTAADDSGRSWLFSGGEWPMIRFLEANGYNVSYVSGVDVHRRGNLLRNHKLFISSGHDEYWSATQRSSMEAARDAGTNLAFFTGNTGFWKTRWESSAAGPSTQDRTLVSYKDTHFQAQEDPVEFTGTWRDPRFTTAANGPKPESALTGQSFLVNAGTTRITVPYAYRQLRMWRNTAATALGPGQSLNLAPSTLGYEWDIDADNEFRPTGQFKLSSTTASGLEVFTDYGSTVKQGGTATHNLTMYKAPSGARVFNAGTVQWSWGLDNSNPDGTAADRNMQQATVNLFADLGSQPSTLLSGLVTAAATTDTTAPTATVAAPPASVADGAQVTLTGTASDAGGGVVAGVEVSTDGGTTWHPATGTTSWSYTWKAHGSPSSTIRARATDDSGNVGAATAGVSVGVNCPCSLWGPNIAPEAEHADSGDPTPIEVGVKFRSDAYGTVTGIRFYKATANTGTHIGSLWTADGQRLAQVTFTGETASGWQQANFSTPVEVQPNTTYVASYYAPNGRFAATLDYFQRAPAPGPHGGGIVDSAPLHALRSTGTTTTTTTNGVYSYSPTSTFPLNSFGAANYWVDVRFSPAAAPGAVSNVTAVAAGTTSANVSWSAPTSGGPVSSYRITPYVGSTAQTPKTITGSPPATTTTVTGLTTGTTYRFTVQALNPNGGGPVSPQSNPVTPAGAVVPAAPTGVAAQPASQSARVTWTAPAADGDSPLTGYTVTPYIGATAQTATNVPATATNATITGLTNGTAYTFRVVAKNAVGSSPASAASAAVTPQATIFDFTAPAVDDAGDTSAVELGVKFRADSNGSITGVRFYKSAANTGTHSGSLWSATGTRLAQATFQNESASGWQHVTFSSPVAVTAGTTYVASYHAPSGRYAATSGAFSSAVDNPPLHALATGTSPNGVYAYGTTSTFPNGTYNASNYWVDVLYAMPLAGQVTGVTASAAGATSASVSWTAPAGGAAVTGYRITPYVGSTAQTAQDDHRLAARDEHHGDRADLGHHLHLPGRGAQRERRGPGLRRVQRRHPAGRGRAHGAHRRERSARVEPGARDLDPAERRRRQPDHRPDRDPVHRRGRADAGPGRPVRHERHRHGARERHRLHVQGDRDQRGRHRAGLHRVERGHAARDDPGLRDPRRGRLGRHRRDRARGQVHDRLPGHGDGHPLLQGGGQHRHAQRQPVDRRRHAARAGHLPERVGERLAARHVLQPRGGVGQHDLRRLLLRTRRPLLRHERRLLLGRRQPAAARRGQRDQRERRLRLRRREQLPDGELGRLQLWRRRPVRGRGRTGRGDRRDRHGGPVVRDGQLDGPGLRRPGHVLQDHALHRRRRADGEDDHGLPAGHLDHGDGAHRRNRVHVPRAGLEPERLGPGVLALQQRDAAVVGRPVGPDGRDRPGRLERRRSSAGRRRATTAAARSPATPSRRPPARPCKPPPAPRMRA